ncbi:hypothetical protein OHB49_43540 (plasmid) [Streptomyces sp. NBC_01717]|nr:hypothetical protein [Streptomyces sp. NBC_01717]
MVALIEKYVVTDCHRFVVESHEPGGGLSGRLEEAGEQVVGDG